MLPALNATLNAASAALLLLGIAAIRGKRQGLHAACMLMAGAVSAAFLTSYLIYHAQVGSVPFEGRGWIRPAYFAILLTHTILAMVLVPMALRTMWLALRRRFDAHKGIARWTFPVWLYVAITGVVIYLLLYHGVPDASACPGCKDALAEPDQLGRRLATAKGFAWSIGFMLGMPALVVGSVAALIVRGRRIDTGKGRR